MGNVKLFGIAKYKDPRTGIEVLRTEHRNTDDEKPCKQCKKEPRQLPSQYGKECRQNHRTQVTGERRLAQKIAAQIAK